jgi:glutamine synthetase
LDAAERNSRSHTANGLLENLAQQGVVGVATTFVDNSGITRVKGFPLSKLPTVAAWGVGISTSFDRFRADDWVAGAGQGEEPVGDLRIIPDLRYVVPLAAQPGWAWSPGDRYEQSGEPHAQCGRLLLRRLTDSLLGHGLSLRVGFEIEWVISKGFGDDFVPAVVGPGYSMARLIDQSDYCRDVIQALDDVGIDIEQFHPEYAAGQLEIAIGPGGPVDAADMTVLARTTIRAVGEKHGFRTSFSPKVAVPGVGNGGHVHISIWRAGQNLMWGGTGPAGFDQQADAFCAGILARLAALLVVGAPSPVSYLRLVPSHWAGVYACWGVENREAAMRVVTGSAGSEQWAANVEIKCFDLFANPYLVVCGLIAAGLAGLSEGRTLPERVQVDPAVLAPETLRRRGINRLPQTLVEAVAAFKSDDVLQTAFGPELSQAIIDIRESDIESCASLDAAALAAATRWNH